MPLLFAACVSEESLPVKEEKLRKVLIDIHLAESATMHLDQLKKDSLTPIYYRQVLEMHEMDRETFDTCVAILKRNPGLMQEVYEQVQEELSKMQVELK
ncbi:MAG: DUF4296 domain-containing protein [Bacteroidota bacterium]